MRINLKPLSVNRCWQGKRFKTKEYINYEKHCLLLMKPLKLPLKPFSVTLEVGVSNSLQDIDNPIKPILDILQKKYQFNDRDIDELIVRKIKVKKGAEYFDYKFCSLKNIA